MRWEITSRLHASFTESLPEESTKMHNPISRQMSRYCKPRIQRPRRARKERCNLSCKHPFQHRLDCIEVFILHCHCIATNRGKELPQFFCGGTVSEHVTRVELSIKSFHFVVPVPQLLLHQQCLTSRCLILPTPLATKCPCDICIFVGDDWQKTHPAELKIVLREFGFFQQLGHARDFALSTC